MNPRKRQPTALPQPTVALAPKPKPKSKLDLTVRVFDKISEAGAALHGYELGVSALTFAAGATSAWFGGDIAALAAPILCATTIGGIGTAAYHRSKRRKEYATAEEVQSQLFAELVALRDQSSKSDVKSRRLRELVEKFKKTSAISATFMIEGTSIERDYFTRLIQLRNCKQLDMQIIQELQRDVHAEIQRSVNVVSQFLCIVTGHACRTSIQIIFEWGASERLTEAKLKTVYWDVESRWKNGEHHTKLLMVSENTATRRLLVDGDPFYVCDDLATEASQGKYLNSQDGWQRSQNALLGVGIPSAVPDHPVRLAGILLVDSLKAKFDNELCRSFINVAARHLGVQLGRTHFLAELQRQAARAQQQEAS
jgi:hypothetical protein